MTWQAFNQLNPAEIERLALLAEEMGEALQIIGKILRHGYESTHPDDEITTNRDLLEKEIGDVQYAIELMAERKDIRLIHLAQHQCEKRKNVQKYLHEQSNSIEDGSQP